MATAKSAPSVAARPSAVLRLASVSVTRDHADWDLARATAAPAALRGQVQTVPQAAETAVKAIPGARLVRLAGLGHSPQVEAPARFEQSLLDAIER